MNAKINLVSKYIFVALLVCLPLSLENCSTDRVELAEFAFNGSTMGTTYHIIITGRPIDAQERSAIATSVDSALLDFNRIYSTYEDQSEISRFNRNESIHPIPVSQKLLQVVAAGQEFCMASDGAFDITVMPIVNFFGFGFKLGENRFPTVDEIDSWLQLTGCDKLEVGDSVLTKSDPRITIDLSAIAKGDGSDYIAKFLMDKGHKNIFVEIGGEIVVHGHNKEGELWKIGIDRPTFGGSPGADLQHVIQLTNKAIASSGDYRNYREVEGKRISHTIDPRTGSPINHNLASVSVIANTCLLADGISTSVMVMGQEEGLSWLEAKDDVEGLLITREPDGSFKEYMTSGFKEYIFE
ncbi:MAG: FAD:protein FMN transferase [FCB group bacterium]|nr:FAD:protein FMN transferase [FCB group bacterium]MBL7028993.1 FAD:protein FMN transferase [Candidatus Neomarinimicrobiota bacterium]MBL7123182.1 FAD:protein FMN transferase [Candidatus Neomarinimicrobiota bacterium]